MKVHYIYHSGYLVETAGCCYIFDYWKGELPVMDPNKPVVVLSSHGHQDHYEPAIFSLLAEAGVKKVFAVLSRDIPAERYPEGVEVLTVRPRKTYELPFGGTLETLLSTDCGVAFLLTTGEGVVYHAGDLNDWYWEGEPEENNAAMTAMYRRELARLADRPIDVAFVVLDARQEGHCWDGLDWFMANTRAARVYPMHYWEQTELIHQFLEKNPQYRGVVLNPEEDRHA